MLELIQDENEFYSIGNDWNCLLEKSGLDNPCLTHEWLTSWWRAYKDNKKLNIIIFKEHGRIIGAIPLVLSKETIFGIPVKVIKFFSDHWGMMDFILTEKKAECISEFFDWFRRAKTADAVILSRMPENSGNAGIIEKLVEGKKFIYEKKESKNTVIFLKAHWGEYLKQLTKKFRGELKSKQKKLFALENVKYERIREVECADKILPSLMAVGAKSWKYKDRKGIVVSSRGRQFYRNLISEWGKTKKLDISLLKHNTLPIAFAFRVAHKDTCYALETAYNHDFYKYSPGLVVNSILLEKLFEEEGVNRYELGEMTDSKKRWSRDYLPEVKLNIYNKTIKMKVLSWFKKTKTFFFKGFGRITGKSIRSISQVFFSKTKCRLLKFIEQPVDTGILERYKIDLRIISPDELNLLSLEKYYSKKIWDDRWRQGADLLGVIWNGKVVEYCWVASKRCYRDIYDGFYIKLNPGECYVFDVRKLEGKPAELGSYRSMKLLFQFIFRLMKERFPDCENTGYSVVEADNKVSLFFYKRYFKAELTANLTFYHFLFWKWFNHKKADETAEAY